ncbi:MAG TPA: class I SAM-dependent methyltransferase [Solirubrobacteraceae bacterium]|nr:class I SAM-dependent methyltransferase [Solirubrobacteraceae bacterium]
MAVPPPELAAYVAACSDDDPVALYLGHGALLSQALVGHFPDELDLAGKRVLDFGCGSGRFLRHLLNAGTGATFEGADIDAACVAWLERHLPEPHRAFRNDPAPPLPRPDGHYALIYATSVFTHLTDTWAAWLCELHRLLDDDVILIATVIDEASGPRFDESPWDDARIGMLVLGPGRPWVAGGPMVLHSEWWIRAHWGRAFDVVAFHPGQGTVFGQAVVVLRRRRVSVTPAELERLEPDEPREVSALAHGLRRSTDENVLLNARHDEYTVAYAAEAARSEQLRQENADLADRLAATRAELAAARRAPAAALTVLRAVRRRVQALIGGFRR